MTWKHGNGSCSASLAVGDSFIILTEQISSLKTCFKPPQNSCITQLNLYNKEHPQPNSKPYFYPHHQVTTKQTRLETSPPTVHYSAHSGSTTFRFTKSLESQCNPGPDKPSSPHRHKEKYINITGDKAVASSPPNLANVTTLLHLVGDERPESLRYFSLMDW